MKVTITTLILLLCSLNASQFLSPEALEESLHDPERFCKSVGTLVVTNAQPLIEIEVGPLIDPVEEIYAARIGPREFKMVTGTCVAIGPRQFLTSLHILKLIEDVGDVGDCFVSMREEISEEELRSALFLKPLYHKVAQIHQDPRGKLAILEFKDDLDVIPLPLRVFDASQSAIGISTACPALLGTPVTPAKLLHTFSYGRDSLRRNEDGLEASFTLPRPLTPGMDAEPDIAATLDMIRHGTIPAESASPVGGSITSISANGDSGAPLLQDGDLVAVCDGWSLSAGSLRKTEPVYILENKFTLVGPYITWIRSILEGRADERMEDEKQAT